MIIDMPFDPKTYDDRTLIAAIKSLRNGEYSPALGTWPLKRLAELEREANSRRILPQKYTPPKP